MWKTHNSYTMEKSTEFARYLTNVVGYATNGIIVQVLFFLGGGGEGTRLLVGS